MASLQVRLSSTTAQIQASENETNMARHKARELQADKTHLERQIENIRAELKQVSNNNQISLRAEGILKYWHVCQDKIHQRAQAAWTT